MNNKGFLVYELVIAFSLTAIIALSLISSTMILKNKSDKISVESIIEIDKTILTNHIMEDIIDYGLTGLEVCKDDTNNTIENCITFKYALNENKNLKIDKINNIIKYGDYIKKYNSKISFDQTATVTATTISGITEGYMDSFLEINIPITSELLDEVKPIKLIHKYDSRMNTYQSFDF